jgi:short-subunit dehydrogenase
VSQAPPSPAVSLDEPLAQPVNATSRLGLAVITGAAGGLGASFADKLAERGHRLLLVDRRRKQLDQLARTIVGRHGVAAEPCVVDLTCRHEVEDLAQRLQHTPDLELLVNNAGFGRMDYFFDTDANFLVDMVDVHVAAPVILTRAALPGMLQRDRGAIINVSSISAWLQSAGNVQYGATKTFLTVFSTALNQELRGTNVRVQALCPGFVRTEFHDSHAMRGFKLRGGPPARFWMSADEVVNYSLRKLSAKQVIVIPGLAYRILGRLAQMPLLQPLIQWATRWPRFAADEAQPSEASGGLSPASSIAHLPESAGNWG